MSLNLKWKNKITGFVERYGSAKGGSSSKENVSTGLSFGLKEENERNWYINYKDTNIPWLARIYWSKWCWCRESICLLILLKIFAVFLHLVFITKYSRRTFEKKENLRFVIFCLVLLFRSGLFSQLLFQQQKLCWVWMSCNKVIYL